MIAHTLQTGVVCYDAVMDIEHLSKSQIILLTLLVSFVTSIATGIVTVSLMDQAPPAVAQTVNRVIERTIETVVATSTPRGQSAATVVTQEKTVVVKESDLISQAVAKISPSIVRIYTNGESPALLGLGIVLDRGGTIVTDNAALDDRADVTLSLSDGTRVRAFVTRRDKENSFAFLTATTTADQKPPVWMPVSIATDHTVLGQSVVAVAGKSVARIAPGVVTSMPDSTTIDTDINGDALLDGSPLVDTDGSIIGLSTAASRLSGAGAFSSGTLLLPPPPAPAPKK